MLTVKREDLERTFRAVREVERRMRNVRGHRARWTGRPAGQKWRWGKLDAELAVSGTATVSCWQTTGGGWKGWDEDSGTNVTAYAPPVQASAIASGTWVLIALINGRWVVVLAACP